MNFLPQVNLLILILLLKASFCHATEELGFDSPPKNIRPPDVVRWEALSAEMNHSMHLTVSLRLSTVQEFGIYKKNLHFELVGALPTEHSFPPALKKIDPTTDEEVEVFSSGEFYLGFQLTGEAPPEQVELSVTYVGCTNSICLFPYTEKLVLPVILQKAASSIQTSESENLSPTALSLENKSKTLTLEEKLMELFASLQKDFWILFFLAFLGGLLTNLTPCVYPMIPITLKILSRTTGHPYAASGLYAFGILVTYTCLGLLAAQTGNAFGSYFSLPWVGILLAAIMIFLGLSMILNVPMGFMQKLGDKISRAQTGYQGAFLMGIGAGFVAAPCTGPVLASLLTLAASSEDQFFSSFGLLSYSLGFSLPYAILGGSAQTILRLRVSPKIQTAVKYAFASLMFSLGLYYLRIPFYDTYQSILPQSLFILKISLAATGCLFFLGLKFKPLFALLTIPLSCVFLFSFLSISLQKSESKSLTWQNDEETAFKLAIEKNAPVLIDFFAEWCEACKKMDVTTFEDSDVIEEIKKQNIVLLKLDLTTNSEQTNQLQKRYNITGLPALIFVKDPSTRSDFRQIGGYVSAAGLLKFLTP